MDINKGMNAQGRLQMDIEIRWKTHDDTIIEDALQRIGQMIKEGYVVIGGGGDAVESWVTLRTPKGELPIERKGG